MRRTGFITSSVIAGAIGATVVGGAIAASPGSEPPEGERAESEVSNDSEFTGTGTAERRTLTQAKEFNASITYGEAIALPIRGQGTVTARPEQGAIVEPGQQLLRIDDKPVFLAQGAMPMYRTLKKTPDVRAQGQRYMVGYDVGHLQQFLIGAGFDDDTKMTVTGIFDPSTEKAVKAWQKSVGLAATGQVDQSQLVIHPDAVRIATTLQLGSEFSWMTVTAVTQTMAFNVSSRDRRLVSEGGSVSIAAPDGTEVDGTVTKLERTVDETGNSVVRATVEPTAPLPADATAAVLTATETLAADVLAVPVRALLAVSQGGFAVEMASPGVDGGGRLVRVEVGDVADGWAEITGDVAEGDEVVTAQ